LGWALDVGFGSNGHDGPETRLPVFSEQRKLSVAVGMSQTCQQAAFQANFYPGAVSQSL
jgi:hypothetical protein